MKKFMAICALVALTMVSVPTTAAAGVERGQKIFKKKFRKYCRFSGVKFARNHTRAEWEEIYDNDEFPQEAKRICPRLKLNKIKESWWEDVYEFTYMYAKDGIVPKC
jgi:hypothetical protein